MKVILALAVLATSANVLASSRDIYDIMYLPNAGTTYGFTEAIGIKGKSEGDDFEGDISAYGLSQTIGHSFSDRFSIQADINYLDQSSDIDQDGVDSFTQTKKGVSDPTFLARFRAMDEAFRLDVFGGVKVSLGDAETDTNINNDSDSNNRSAGHSMIGGVQFGQKSEAFQWAILGQLTYNLGGTEDTDGTKDDTESNNELLLRADVLTKLAEKSFLRPFVQVDFMEKVELEDGGESEAPITEYRLGAEYQYLASQDLLFRAGVDYSTQNAADFDEIYYWSFRLGANYQF